MNQAATQFPVVADLSLRAERVLAGLYAIRSIEEKLASLSLDEDSVRRFIFNIYPQLGRAPKRQEIESAFPQHAVEHIDRICRRLHEKDIVYIPEGSCEIAGAYPFTDLRNNHLVKFQWQEKHRSVYAMCAVDALGIPFMLKVDAEIQSSCAHCDTEISINVRDESITAAEPFSTVVFVGLSCAKSAATSLCVSILFFCCFKLKGAIRSIAGIYQCDFNGRQQVVVVVFDRTRVKLEDLQRATEKAGFQVALLKSP